MSESALLIKFQKKNQNWSLGRCWLRSFSSPETLCGGRVYFFGVGVCTDNQRARWYSQTPISTEANIQGKSFSRPHLQSHLLRQMVCSERGHPYFCSVELPYVIGRVGSFCHNVFVSSVMSSFSFFWVILYSKDINPIGCPNSTFVTHF